MPNPKRRWSKTRTAKRRTHYKAEAPTVMTCTNCGSPVRYHRVCPECGFYRGRQVMEVSKAN
ncbi:MAG: 50S ribosomal protein L32 [Sphingobacteriia bacterium]|nr:50S ribosomal protein L32 [Sphingobacteriia bacterium]